MGYDLHITRAELHFENDGHKIAAEEWMRYIQDDHELEPSPENGAYFVIWKGSTMYEETWFDWSDGNIFTKNPDGATVSKMLKIAQSLNARVQGDEGEFYDDASTFPE
jgi:hypothetical protein